MIHNAVILGGGSAGLLAALSLKKHLPQLTVRVVHSREIGIIGVGEGSTGDLPNHLHGFLGIDPGDFHKRAKPTWKLGVHFLWGPRVSFDYTFTKTYVGAANGLSRQVGYYAWENCDALDLNSALMHERKALARLQNGSPLVQRNLAYHLENADFVAALEHYALALGIVFTEGKMQSVERGPEGVAAIVLESDERVTADLFVDASGFRSELLGAALEEPFQSFEDTLFCDRAIAGGWERADEPVLPYTVAETMDAGWAWQIEHERHINRGYVFSSAFLSDAAAEAEFRRKNPKVQKTRIVKWRTGRRARTWVGNVVALGNSAGFVEPLEATAIFVICNAARALAVALIDSERDPQPTARESYNNMVNRMWDEIRDFLAVHYRFNTRLDTPFWRHCRENTALHGAGRIVRFYQENGPSTAFALELLTPESSIFQLEGFYALLLGQKVRHRLVRPLTADEEKILATLRDTHLRQARSGFGVAESLALIRGPHWKWTPGFYQV
ncbi:MAG: FAD-dependent oxidoreductase [Chthoniobacteraceae bacterium]